jgi:anaerobic ribonucleoside-triphosphate reductase
MKQRTRCEVYSRVCGYIRPTSQWNEGKAEEFKDRVMMKW